MKKYSVFIFTIFILLTSCKKDKIISTADQVGISKVTYFPILTMKGDNIMVVEKGGTFTDPGVTAKAGESDVPVTSTGTVNTSTPGVYTINYSATNKDGFSASLRRTVAVYSTAADAAAHDLSGDYARTSNGSVASWTKLAPGVYKVFNPGGAPGTNLTVIVFNPSGYDIFIPEQVSSDGSITSSSNESYTNGSPAQYSWKVINPGYGTGQRTFIKQ
jgi:hypothetical protein